MRILPITTNFNNFRINQNNRKFISNAIQKYDSISFRSKRPEVTIGDIEELYSKKDIQSAIQKTAKEINDYYNGEPITTICILKGAMPFNNDLVKKLNMEVREEEEKLSSYDGVESTGCVIPEGLCDLKSLEGKNVLIVEDIIDTGTTLSEYKKQIEKYNPKSVKIAVLLDKQSDRRKKGTVKPDFVSICHVGDDYVVGYGMDYNQIFRSLPYIGRIKESKLQEIKEYNSNSN